MSGDENKKLNTEPEEDDEIIIDETATVNIHFTHSYLPYTYWRIVEILNDYYNMELLRVRAYKEGRYPGYKNRYALKDKETGEVIGGNIRLDRLRMLFAEKDIPLSYGNRNLKADYFLQIVEEIAKQQKAEKGEETCK